MGVVQVVKGDGLEEVIGRGLTYKTEEGIGVVKKRGLRLS